MGNEPGGPWYHEDRSRFRDALTLTEAESDFSARLIEKDYYCSLLLHDLRDRSSKVWCSKGAPA